ncbi:DNA helicase [Mycobacteroides abscessus subsp. massiliense]|uniref:AAA domain-containing protein n=1 Tax=Mycobacteroides abscessus TaxID=36809 RepID=UPI0009A75201|nr:AAA domain-containing protein [Mycobacteroides abscessus]SKT78184.1 DNA helicase [Mycobacteroides abscessus subsp. massiliense]
MDVDLIRKKADEWAHELIQLNPRNGLVNFTITKSLTLDLTECAADSVAAALSGRPTRLGTLFDTEETHRNACARARNLARELRNHSEEQGIDVGRLVYGRVVNEPSGRTGVNAPVKLRAPLLLHQVALQARTATESDFTLQVRPEPELNPVLLQCLDREYGVQIDSDEIDRQFADIVTEAQTLSERAERAFALVAEKAQQQGVTLHLEPLIAVGVCKYQKLPMVLDLGSSTQLLAEHDLIAALAGCPLNESELSGTLTYEPPDIDSVSPQNEFLVLDADSSQHHAIATALAGRHVIIDGPPGTGKSQTIANIIAAGSAAGLKILFVAEKRAAIEAVTDRLEVVGLGSLVLDLHQSKINKRSVAEQFSSSLDQLSNSLPVQSDDEHHQLSTRRQALKEYVAALHMRRTPWELSTYEVRESLLKLSVSDNVNIRLPQLNLFDPPRRRQITEALREFIEGGGLRILRRESPWSQADLHTKDDVDRVFAELDEVRGRSWKQTQANMHRLLERAGLVVPQTFSEWDTTLLLLEDVSGTVGALGASIFGEDLDEFYAATAPRQERRRLRPEMTWRRRRGLLKELRDGNPTGIKQKRQLHQALGKALTQRAAWYQRCAVPSKPGHFEDLAAVSGQYKQLQARLTAIAMYTKVIVPASQPIATVDATLQDLDNERDLAYRLPDLYDKQQLLSKFGLDELLSRICERNMSADQAVLLFEWTLMRALNQEFTLSSPALRNFVAESHDRILAEFMTAEQRHIELAAQRVLRCVATSAHETGRRHPDQSRLLRREASKKRQHMPLRQLVGQAPDLMLAVRPCWAMSPLIVSQMLPAQQLFDLVIFDEASQVRPHDAITSIMRGRHLIVAGDDKQLPPTNFFDSSDSAETTPEDEPQVNLRDYESILTTLQPLIPDRRRLRWHYRSQDERLIGFSNEYIYGRELVTFPGARLQTPLRLDVVDGRVQPGQQGSADAEVSHVIDLVMEHARTRPYESLGVITLGEPHRDRLDAALRRRLSEQPDLVEFFAEDRGPTRRFFIKNLEAVQGDERDAIIFSLGVGKTAAGRLNRKGFGPLNYDGSQRRLNVAITRAKRRMTVVSSFPPGTLEPSGRETGTDLLRKYLDTASAGGDTRAVGGQENVELNGFEQDIYRRLLARGITVFPQWGVSGYRIDFALAHPDEPGRMVLAVEADGHRYHSAESVRDRDRLRQQHLERLGWRFHRVWSSAWFADPEKEEQRIVQAWQQAVLESDDQSRGGKTNTAAPQPLPRHQHTSTPQIRRTLPRPDLQPGLPIDQYTQSELVALFSWLMSDDRLLDTEERMRQARDELGFKRRGSRIDAQLSRAVDQAQQQLDRKNT